MRRRHQHYIPPALTYEPPRELYLPLERPSVPVDTSEAAAESMKGIAGRQRAMVLFHLKAKGAEGATALELESALGLSGSSIRPRLWELENHGDIVKTKETRRTPSGRQARVYKVA